MKVVILAGGLGTRLAEETELRPKPMVEIGAYPILWHILMHYSYYGHKEFLIALGYKGEYVKRYFVDQVQLNGDMTIRMGHGEIDQHRCVKQDWLLHLADTGRETATGGRLRRLRPLLDNQTFMLTYGDGVANIDLNALIRFHKSCGRLVTVTAVRPPARYGGLIFDGNLVARFTEKPQVGEGWINGGFLVCEPGIFYHLEGDACSLESHTLEKLASEGQLAAYRHEGFWQCMDTLRDKLLLENLWKSANAPWKVWAAE